VKFDNVDYLTSHGRKLADLLSIAGDGCDVELLSKTQDF